MPAVHMHRFVRRWETAKVAKLNAIIDKAKADGRLNAMPGKSRQTPLPARFLVRSPRPAS
ncbi:hypothetical protein AB870_14065 [Pandoraea faecigallinarum]|uniref:Uncharacterized protein n=1 Tax=Pandoraea faecigallinarum TaxID=656179 RepID=A0A0H3WWK7_9BURK|nr:hypothetical protein AB870_14065 [Pandoraea faecigallinarum]